MKSKIVMALMAMMVMSSVVMGAIERIDSKEAVLDTDTKLLWQDNSDVTTIKKDLQGAKEFCKNLNLAGYNDWVLPDKDTIEALYLKKNSLKNGFSDLFWTSTSDGEHYNNSKLSWVIDFNFGKASIRYDSDSYGVRCVSSAQLSEPLIIELKKQEEAKRIKAEADKKDENAYNKASSTNTIASYKEYLKIYPNGNYASSAKSRIESMEYENKYSAVLSSKDPQSMYLAAIKYENNGERGRAKKIYLTIMDNFEKSPMALKAADRLAALSDVEAVESSNRANQRAIKDAANQKLSNSRQECENSKKACLAGCGTYISGADSHNSAVWSCNDKCKQISCY